MKHVLLYFFFCFRFISSNAQVQDHAKWNFAVEKISDKQLQVVFTASLDSGWHIYSSQMEDGGPQKTIVSVVRVIAFKVAENTTESAS